MKAPTVPISTAAVAKEATKFSSERHSSGVLPEVICFIVAAPGTAGSDPGAVKFPVNLMSIFDWKLKLIVAFWEGEGLPFIVQIVGALFSV